MDSLKLEPNKNSRPSYNEENDNFTIALHSRSTSPREYIRKFVNSRYFPSIPRFERE